MAGHRKTNEGYLMLIAFLCLFVFMTSGLFSQTQMPVAGMFAHYAVGDSWSSTIYLNVDGKGTNMSSCDYRLEFYNQNGSKVHEMSFNRQADYSFRDNLIKIEVPFFTHHVLSVGPVLIRSSCTESYPIKFGELVFSQTLNGKTIDGTVEYVRYQAFPEGLVDLDRFVYGFAIFNPSSNARAVSIEVRNDKNTEQIQKALFTLAGMEQRIFVLTDLVPELRNKRGVYVVEFGSSPFTELNEIPIVLMLKFNSSGGFSTGILN